jgi:hypothetical protein
MPIQHDESKTFNSNKATTVVNTSYSQKIDLV